MYSNIDVQHILSKHTVKAYSEFSNVGDIVTNLIQTMILTEDD